MTKPMQRSYLLRLWHDHAGAPMRTTLIIETLANASERSIAP